MKPGLPSDGCGTRRTAPPNRGGAREAADSKWAASSPRQVGGVLERPGRNRLVGLPSDAGRPLAEDRGTTGQGFQKPDWPSHTRRSHPTQTLCDARGGVRPGEWGRGGISTLRGTVWRPLAGCSDLRGRFSIHWGLSRRTRKNRQRAVGSRLENRDRRGGEEVCMFVGRKQHR